MPLQTHVCKASRVPVVCTIASLLIASAVATPAVATPITLTFNEFASAGSLAVAAGSEVGYSNPNHMTYGNLAPNILLGDDGYAHKMSVAANAGTLFDALSVDLVEGRRSVFEATLDPDLPMDAWDQMFTAIASSSASDYIYDNMVFEGYRWDQLIALETLSYDGDAALTHDLSEDFKDLTRLDISVTFAGANFFIPTIENGKVMFCQGSCGYVRFDNLVLDTRATPVSAAAITGPSPTVTPVPVPGLLLMTSLGVLGLLNWSRRKTRPRAKPQ